jgi:hypothetical protein
MEVTLDFYGQKVGFPVAQLPPFAAVADGVKTLSFICSGAQHLPHAFDNHYQLRSLCLDIVHASEDPNIAAVSFLSFYLFLCALFSFLPANPVTLVKL